VLDHDNMPHAPVEAERIKILSDSATRDGDYVLYWMQQSQRAEFNPALEFSIARANECGKRLLVAFGLTDSYPEANERHYRFLLEGLQETQAAIERRGIRFVIRRGSPDEVAIAAGRHAAEVICDCGYLRHQKQWRQAVAEALRCRVWQVEADVVVPVETASNKREFAARTLRPKLSKLRDRFLTELRPTPLDKDSLNLPADRIELDDLDALLARLSLDRSVRGVSERFAGGTSQAKARLKSFLADDLSKYDQRNHPDHPRVSELGPYLHFGQISPVAVALQVEQSRGHARPQKEAFLEELIVRRELAINFVHYTRDYDAYACLPDWACQTLAEHKHDRREYRYSAAELESGQTHDLAWNAAMLEMRHTGYLHNHIRMYWGKKILEWSNTPQHAFRTALALNNKYFLDGRDANSFANVAWIFGLHDRPFAERDIFGKVRYMSADGLRRKFDVDAWIEQVRHKTEDLSG
jgi:deoxyribodipyrimidine photo-lyase